MSRAVRFLAAFNDIEQYFRSRFAAENHDSFNRLLHLAEKHRVVSSTQARELKKFADLRNCISHGTYDGELRPIADPYPEAIAEIEALREIIMHPPVALHVMPHRPVRILSPQSTIGEALALIRTEHISQIPIYDQGIFQALLTTNAIARWVAADLNDNGQLDATTVAEALAYAEDSDLAQFVPRDATAQFVLEEFTSPPTTPGAGLPTAIIVTEHGKPSQKPLGIVTRADIPLFLEALSVPEIPENP